MDIAFWRNQKIPKPIYEMLPFIYLLLGAWVFVVGQGFPAVVSGLTLCLAAGLVFIWRRDARLAAQSTRRRR